MLGDGVVHVYIQLKKVLPRLSNEQWAEIFSIYLK